MWKCDQSVSAEAYQDYQYKHFHSWYDHGKVDDDILKSIFLDLRIAKLEELEAELENNHSQRLCQVSNEKENHRIKCTLLVQHNA